MVDGVLLGIFIYWAGTAGGGERGVTGSPHALGEPP